jgi:TRAP-type C4-dicarboxylate transport system permease small subunit
MRTGDPLLVRIAIITDRELRRLYLACAALAAISLVVIALAVLTSILSRLLGIYVPGTTEIAGYGMAATGALGLAQTAFSRGHIRVDLVLARLREVARSRTEILAHAVTLGFVAFAAWHVSRMVITSHRFGDLSAGSDNLPIWIPQLPVAVGFIVFALALAHMTVLGLLGQSVDNLPATERDVE